MNRRAFILNAQTLYGFCALVLPACSGDAALAHCQPCLPDCKRGSDLKPWLSAAPVAGQPNLRRENSIFYAMPRHGDEQADFAEGSSNP